MVLLISVLGLDLACLGFVLLYVLVQLPVADMHDGLGVVLLFCATACYAKCA